MTAENQSPQVLSLQSLTGLCTEQTARFYNDRDSDTRYCFEIFRRAILERSQEAWNSIYQVYTAQVVRWVRRHPAFALMGETEDLFVNRAFEKLWQAVTPARFASFPDLKHLLSYLQLCVHSAITDHLRANREAAHQVEFDRAEDIADEQPVDDVLLGSTQAQELWAQVCTCLNDQKEHLVAHDSFLLGLKPAEIQARYPLTFESTREVYRIKESVLERLRRNPDLLRQFLARPESNS
jgi:RNA polymerase sigma factor (sigma-70 family)